MKKTLGILAGIYVAAWGLYLIKSWAGIDIFPGHHGQVFPGAWRLVVEARGNS